MYSTHNIYITILESVSGKNSTKLLFIHKSNTGKQTKCRVLACSICWSMWESGVQRQPVGECHSS